MLLLMLVAGISGAAAQSLSISDFSIKAGDTKTVAIALAAEDDIYGVQTDLELCSGLTLEHAQPINANMKVYTNKNQSGDKIRMSLLTLNGEAVAKDANGVVINLTLQAADDFEGGTIKLSNSRLTTSPAGAEEKVSDDEATVTLESEPGIDPNELIVNGDFEGTYSNKIQNSSGNNLRYVREPEGWVLEYSDGCQWDASILSKDDELYNTIGSKITIPGDGRGNQTYAVRLHGNAQNSRITLTQGTHIFPKGKYTLTGSFFTENQNELEVGFFLGSYSNETRIKYTGGNGNWRTLTTEFESDGTLETAIGVFFKHNSGNAMIAGVDNITITFTPFVYPTALTLNELSLNLTIGETATLTPTLTPADANKDFEITWESSDPKVATVVDGVVTAVGPGSATITATTGNDIASSCEVTVTFNGEPIDFTYRVVNPTFDTDLTGWNSPIGGGSEVKVADNRQDQTRYFYQTWNGTPKEGRMYQLVENLPQGTYELELIAFASQAGTMTPASTAVAVYAQGQEVGTTSSSYVRPNYVNSTDFTSYKTYAYVDATGKLEIGMRQYAPAQFRWLGMDNVTLKYIATGNQEEAKMLALYQEKWTAVKASLGDVLTDETYAGVLGKERTDLVAALGGTIAELSDYKTVADNAQTAYLAFMAALPAYEECEKEYAHYQSLSGTATYASFITETSTPTDVLNAIKEAEYVAVTTKYDTDGSALFIPSWDNSGFGSLTAQHWSGEEREYFDKWSGSPSSGSISKTVTLPQGHYVFYAAGRGQANSESAVTLKVVYGETTLTQDYTMKGDTGKGIDTSGAANFGEGNFAYNGAGRGWEWRYIAFELDSDTEVTLLIEGSVNNSWIGACDTKLLTYDNIAVNRQQYEAALAAAKEYQDDDMFEEDKASLNTVITDNTLTVNSATQAELTAATEALNVAAEKAAIDVARYTTYTNATTAIGENTNVDLTALLKNPSFESSSAGVLVAHGWTNEGVGIQGQTNNGFDGYREGNVFAERWANNVAIGAFKTYQTIDALPAGLYEVSVVATFNGSGASFFVDDATVAITDAGTYKLMAQVADKGNLTIGVQTINPTGSWFKCDNFQLKYVGTEFPEYELATGKMGTDKSAAQTAAETAFLSDKTAESYNALLAAIGEAETSVANYAALKTAIENAEAIKAANNFVTADAITTFEGVIASAQAAWDNVTYTDQQAKDEVGALGWHSCNYMGSAWVTPDPKPEVWWYFNTWSTEGNNDGTNFLTPFFENFKGSTDNLPDNTFTASLGGLENGTYEIEVWARVQRRTDANFNGDNSMITMSVNGGEAVSLMNGSTKVNQGANNEMRLDRFKAVGVVTDGTLTLAINVKLGSNVHWLSWRDVKYKKLDIDVPMFVSSVAEWGTFVAPFDVEIPEGVTAYTVDGVNENKELQMSKVEDNIIPAHTPVLLNSKDKVEETVSGVPQDLEGELKVGWLVGTYEEIFAENGWYILQKHEGKDEAAFYRVDTKTAQPEVPAYRAYLSVPSSEESRVFYLNGEATAIKAIEALTGGEAEIYDVNGRRQVKLQKGVNIIRTKDGRTNKVMVK